MAFLIESRHLLTASKSTFVKYYLSSIHFMALISYLHFIGMLLYCSNAILPEPTIATTKTERCQLNIVHIQFKPMGFHCFISTEAKHKNDKKKKKKNKAVSISPLDLWVKSLLITYLTSWNDKIIVSAIFPAVSFFKFLTGFMFERRWFGSCTYERSWSMFYISCTKLCWQNGCWWTYNPAVVGGKRFCSMCPAIRTNISVSWKFSDWLTFPKFENWIISKIFDNKMIRLKHSMPDWNMILTIQWRTTQWHKSPLFRNNMNIAINIWFIHLHFHLQ